MILAGMQKQKVYIKRPTKSLADWNQQTQVKKTERYSSLSQNHYPHKNFEREKEDKHHIWLSDLLIITNPTLMSRFLW